MCVNFSFQIMFLNYVMMVKSYFSEIVPVCGDQLYKNKTTPARNTPLICQKIQLQTIYWTFCLIEKKSTGVKTKLISIVLDNILLLSRHRKLTERYLQFLSLDMFVNFTFLTPSVWPSLISPWAQCSELRVTSETLARLEHLSICTLIITPRYV